jgi:hypothetical protein
MKFSKQLIVAAFAAMLAASSLAAVELPPEESLAARKAIVAWLECEECTEGELEAVLKLGQAAVPSLAATLERGPSPASLEKLRLHLESTYRQLVEYSRTHEEVKIDFSQEEYVKVYLENYVANHGVRAAQALGRIGGETARKSLENAGKLPLREDVKKVVEESAKGFRR